MILDGNDVQHFQFFANQVKEALVKYGKLDKDQLLEIQRGQVNTLSKLEADFKKALMKSGQAKDAFEAFYDLLINEKKNLLLARPFFRERAESFVGDGIVDSIKNRQYKKTAKWHLNYHFISYVYKKLGLGKNESLKKIFDKISAARIELVLMNMPLAISRARIFYSRTPRSHLSFMDLVQIAAVGMLNAIDKYCGTYEKVWRSVVIGRITGDVIKLYNDPLLHFSSDERRALYRANRVLARNKEASDKELLDAVNKLSEGEEAERLTIAPNKLARWDKRHTVDINAIRELVRAASLVSCDTKPPVDDEHDADDNITRKSAPIEERPDTVAELQESYLLMIKHIKKLPLLDQKILRLKGVEFDVGS